MFVGQSFAKGFDASDRNLEAVKKVSSAFPSILSTKDIIFDAYLITESSGEVLYFQCFLMHNISRERS